MNTAAAFQTNEASDSSGTVEEYMRKRPIQEEFTRRMLELVRELLRSEAVDFHLIESRTKEVSSFRDKISRASKLYTDPIHEITDLSGIRIIAYYEDDVEVVAKLVEREFHVDWANSTNRRASMRPEEFGYQSVHYVVSLNDVRRGLREWQQFSDHRAEIQVRTVLQHAWAAISHKLQYKREAEVPSQLRRKLFRLSALMEMADEQFLSVRDATVELSANIEANFAQGKMDAEINLLSVEEFLKTAAVVREIIEIAERHGFEGATYGDKSIMNPENLTDESVSDLITVARHAGLTRVTQLVDALQSSLPWADEYLKRVKESAPENWIVNPAFVCELMLVGIFTDRLGVEALLKHKWGRFTATRVVTVAAKFLEERAKSQKHTRQSQGSGATGG